jgi:hypothetical protein
MTAPAGWVGLARILRPQGRKGEVFAHILTDFPEKFASRRHLWLITAGAPGPGSARLTTHSLGAPGPSHLGTGETSSVDQQAGAPGPDLGTRETGMRRLNLIRPGHYFGRCISNRSCVRT